MRYLLDLVRHLRSRTAGSIYGCLISPPVAAQVITAMRIMSGEDNTQIGRIRNARLARNVRYFRRRLRQMGFIVYGHEDSAVIPVLGFYMAKVAMFGRETLKRNVAAVSVGFPATPITKPRARFTVSADHTKEQLDRVLEVIDEVGDLTGFKYLRPDPSITAEF